MESVRILVEVRASYEGHIEVQLALNQYGIDLRATSFELDRYIAFQPQISDKGRPRQIEPSCSKKRQARKTHEALLAELRCHTGLSW